MRPLRRLAAALLLCAVACGGDSDDSGGSGGSDGSGSEGAQRGDHWHAVFGVYRCGQFLAARSDNDPLGIHAHNDGLIHIHPFGEAASGENATLQVFLDTVGIDPDELTEGAPCDVSGKDVRLIVDGEDVDTDPGDLVLQDGQTIVLAVAEPDEEIGEPPWAQEIESPSDLP